MENKIKYHIKGVRFVKVFLDIKKDYDLTGEQAMLYGFLYNWCMEMGESRFCGFSDEKIADTLGVKIATHKRNLKALLEKDLIYIKNAGSRSKKKGESREIYINDKIFLDDEVAKQLDEAERVKAENEQLKKQLKLMNERLLALQEEQPTISYLAKDLINTGYVSKEEYMQHWKDYNMLLEQFQQSVGFIDFNHRLKRVVRNCKNKNIYDKVAYLRGSLINNATDYHRVFSMYEDIEIEE